MTRLATPLIAASLLGALTTPACAQSLARRIDGSANATVQFSFAARAGVCGDGRTYIRADDDGFYGSYNDFTRAYPCEAGPVRVLVTRADRTPVRLETFVGPLRPDSLAADLGRVGAGEAATWLLDLAKSAEGRVARDALLPASLADSSRITDALLAIARDDGRPRELRRSALSWATRRRTASDAMADAAVVRLLTEIARDDAQPTAMRQTAVSGLARSDRPSGIPVLIGLVASDDSWLARESAEVLGRSGDPRARQAVRALVTDDAKPGEVRAKAIGALAGEYGTASDAKVIMDAYPRLGTDRLREAALGAVATIGGRDARTWLLGVARNKDEGMNQRRRAVSMLDRVGIPSAELVKLYDEVEDTDLRSSLIDELAQVGTREAIDKLIRIANGDAMMNLRRRAVQVLSRNDDPRVRSALKSIAEDGKR